MIQRAQPSLHNSHVVQHHAFPPRVTSPPPINVPPRLRLTSEAPINLPPINSNNNNNNNNKEMQTGEEERNNVELRRNGEEKDKNTPLMALNHVSRVCRSVKESVGFYTKLLGFVLIERPGSFDFDGAWLFNYGVGIHLVQCKDEEKLPRDKDCLDPMDNHISFQCESLEDMEQKLKDGNIKYMKRIVGDEDGAPIEQLFFNDPDGYMIEICNCENLKLVPQRSIGRIKLPSDKQ